MAALPRVCDVDFLGGRTLRVVFTDGLVRELDFADALPGVLAAIDNSATFAAVAVDGVTGTLCWPCGIDLDPDVLHGSENAAASHQPRVLREYRLERTK